MTPLLNIAARVPVTEAEGPGKRFAIWVQGCPLRCAGCCNPQYLEFQSRLADAITPAILAEEILRYEDRIEGVTFVGGEPFAQAAGLAETAARVKSAANLSVMVFSGFTLEQLRDAAHPDLKVRTAFLHEIDLLVDGPYIRDQHETSRRWIGSSNQRIHFLTRRYAHLSPEGEGWPSGGNTIELRIRDGQLLINGFPHASITAASHNLRRREQRKRTS